MYEIQMFNRIKPLLLEVQLMYSLSYSRSNVCHIIDPQ